MAITFITGIPRSGKSYYAMYLLYMSFIYEKPVTRFSKVADVFLPRKTLDKKYDIAYTNINQFDFTKSDKIKLFKFEYIYPHLAILNQMKLQNKTDSELIEYASSYGLNNALFVIDECQLYFAKEDIVLTWWLTYHGHLHQDIILITQNFDLLEKSYFKLAEFYYRAVPPSARLFSKKFRYIQYNSYKLFKTEKIGDFHVPMMPQIFSMYVSGASNNTKSVVKRYFLYFSLLFILTLVLFLNFVGQFDTSKKEVVSDKNITSVADKNLTVTHSNPSKNDTKVIFDTSDNVLFDIRCVDMLCTYEKTDFPKPLLNKILNKTTPDFVWFFNNGTYIQYFVMLPADTFKFLKIGEKENDKKSKNEGNFNPIAKLSSK